MRKNLVFAALIAFAAVACGPKGPYGKTNTSWWKDYHTISVNVVDETYNGYIVEAVDAELSRMKLLDEKNPGVRVGGAFKSEPTAIIDGVKTHKYTLALQFTKGGQTYKVAPMEWESQGSDDKRAYREGVDANLERVLKVILKEAEKR